MGFKKKLGRIENVLIFYRFTPCLKNVTFIAFINTPFITFMITMEIAIEQFEIFNPFLTYVPLTDKPYSWFLPAKCMKNIVEE